MIRVTFELLAELLDNLPDVALGEIRHTQYDALSSHQWPVVANDLHTHSGDDKAGKNRHTQSYIMRLPDLLFSFSSIIKSLPAVRYPTQAHTHTTVRASFTNSSITMHARKVVYTLKRGCTHVEGA